MPYELFLALRYLRVRRGRRVARWTALAAVAGIACGVAALIAAQALARGFRDELRDKILAGTAHVTLSREGELDAARAREAAGRLREVEGVREAAPTVYAGGLLTGPGGVTYAVLRGVEGSAARARAGIERTLTRGRLEDIFQTAAGPKDAAVPVVLGAELAETAGLAEVGAEGWLVTGGAGEGDAMLTPRAVRVRVAGLFKSGLYEYDATWAYVSIEEAGRAGGPVRAVLSVEAEDVYASEEVARRARAALGAGWTAVDWREANRPLFAALELERRVVSLIILLIMTLAALNITTTLALVVVERRADIAVLVALGARARSVMAVFVMEGAAVGVVGAVAGVALGLLACALAERFGLVSLPADVYSIGAVPLRPQLSDVLPPALSAVVIGVLATLYPARQAARVRPAEVLRYE
ncbi:MAG TPA: FtsX-like permease family protein [Pyrinomonadaceae bacterium]|jgi:lipoprotein-releasing system permease protein|nr:FtsX-like permease family protein [Pyrinomonadaceae bacterium]